MYLVITNKHKEKRMSDEYDYRKLFSQIHDQTIKDIFSTDIPLDTLLEDLSQEDILVPSQKAQVPFFASIRDYTGAYYDNDPDNLWIIKPLAEEELCQARLGMFAYFLNHFTGTISAPSIVAKINNKYYRASKIIQRTEQLSGAPYQENQQLTAQLTLDLINSWIYFDEDRNPNNYLIYYNSNNIPVVIAIDFSNIDLLTDKMKIKGRDDIFGWERKEKTRYLTPLKNEQFYELSFDFFKTRLDKFKQIDEAILKNIGKAIFSDDYDTSGKELVEQISTNILSRIEYVYSYFESWFNDPEKLKLLRKRTKQEMKDEYHLMGRFFNEKLNQ